MALDIVNFILESNAIEGIFAEPGEPHFDRHFEAFTTMQKIALIDIELPNSLLYHLQLLAGIEPFAGQYRTVNVRVDDYLAPHFLRVPEMMERWLTNLMMILDADLTADVAWFYHNWFESIHPFQDGNGRVGRLILAHLCLMAGEELPIIKASEKQEYYQKIVGWRKENPGWMSY